MKKDCPFCNGDIEGCCFCDHTGKIEVGPGNVFTTEEDLKPFTGPKVLESDLRKLFDRGGLNHIRPRSGEIL